ncbi:MAG: XRE family transcriptional regulator [Anaerolineaceae bacterium]|nr:XRE family transcriptional regulator [Anaerolineaceae bacterium]MDE0328212.1 XRE family transcriptional regulator [Anaerolineaceae bacterium]
MVGARIYHARLMAGMTRADVADALDRVGIPTSSSRISKFESGNVAVNSTMLLALSKLFDVPPVWLLHKPTTTVDWLAYRKRSTLPKRTRTEIELSANDVASLHVELREKLYPDASFEFSERVKVVDAKGAEEAAQMLRAAWGLGDTPIENLTQTAETRGVVVIGQNQVSERFDGLAGYIGEDVPVIVINSEVETDRQRFNLAHELGHLVMQTSDDTAEKLAHRFAAALLVPEEVARRELGENRNTVSFLELGALKRRYGLSMQGWVYRASDLGIFSSGLVRAFWREVNRRGWKKSEPFDFVADEEPVLLNQMISRALEGGVVSTERIQQALPQYEFQSSFSEVSEPPSATELMKMSAEERKAWTTRAFAKAKEMDFEIFEAFGEEELRHLGE